MKRGQMPDVPIQSAAGLGATSIFPPIADYAFLSNCEQSCLVAPDGTVEWLCLPRPDAPSVFGALLDRTAGMFGAKMLPRVSATCSTDPKIQALFLRKCPPYVPP